MKDPIVITPTWSGLAIGMMRAYRDTESVDAMRALETEITRMASLADAMSDIVRASRGETPVKLIDSDVYEVMWNAIAKVTSA